MTEQHPENGHELPLETRPEGLPTLNTENRTEYHSILDPRRVLWTPGTEQIAASNIVAFIKFLEAKQVSPIPSLDNLYQWSIENSETFWKSFLHFSDMIYEGDDTDVLTYAPLPNPIEGRGPHGALRPPPPGEGIKQRMIDARWFPSVRLNFAENLLRYAETQPEKEAIAFFGEDRVERHLTFRELKEDAIRFSYTLDAYGVGKGDRVVALMPNVPETVSAMLATTARGAIWSSISPEYGADVIIDRFSQLEPKLLIASSHHLYRGKIHDDLSKIEKVQESLPSLQNTFLVPEGWGPPDASIPLLFHRLPFNHPLFILFSSGTEGKPKCIVHGAGGALLNQLKQHMLHTNLTENDTLFFRTTTSWMMWNSLVSALATGAKIVLYDGDPLVRNGQILFDLAEEEKITVFGTSAEYISKIEQQGLRPRETHDLSSIRTILSTGSVLYGPQFDYVYNHVHPTVQLASTSGGTEIMGAFATSSSIHPVRRGELQTRSLGYNVEIFNEEGNPVPRGVRGELVCTAPFPSQPVGFWNDPGDQRYLDQYFKKYGPNIWHHGDDAELTPSGGMVIHGRSDDILKPGGVRMGPAEITMQTEKIPEVLQSVAVGQTIDQHQRVVLMVILRDNQQLTPDIEHRIRTQIRLGASPYHVPKIILAVPDFPRTRNGKISLSAIRSAIHGRAITNIDAIANPESLESFKNRPELVV